MLWIETHKPWARLVIHQSLTTTVVKIVRLSKSTLSPDELTCSVRSKRRDQNQSDNRDIHDKLNPLYTLFTMINIFHDIYLSFSFLIFDYIFFHSVQFRIFTCSHYFVTLKSETFKFRTSTGFEPVTSQYRCDAPPTQLWSHWRWEQVNCGLICSRERNEC